MTVLPFPQGCTRTPGKRHLHVDGAQNIRDLETIQAFADELGYPSEILFVKECLENEHRTDIPDKKGHHEPNLPGDLISTTLVEPFDEFAVSRLIKFILQFLQGVTVELEHVIGAAPDDAPCVWQDWRRVEPVEFDFERIRHTSPDFDPVEYHLALDAPRPEDAPELENLMAETLRAGIMVGTWYNFGGKRLRSNRFAQTDGIVPLVEGDYAKFQEMCRQNGWEGHTRVVAELVLGIWTSRK